MLVKLLKQRIRETEELLRKFSQAMQGLQGQLNRDRAEFKQNETTLAELATVLETRDTQQEFQRILSLPGVVAIYVKDQALCVQVNARYQYQGSWYDMGDWELQIRDGRKHIYAREIRAGATDEYYRRRRTYEGWLTGDGSGYGYHPDYHMPSDNKDGEFCFAAQSDIIAKHISKGEILNALCLAVLSLQYVNEEDRDYIPDRLRRIV
jgi:hypothetical protein